MTAEQNGSAETNNLMRLMFSVKCPLEEPPELLATVFFWHHAVDNRSIHQQHFK